MWPNITLNSEKTQLPSIALVILWQQIKKMFMKAIGYMV